MGIPEIINSLIDLVVKLIASFVGYKDTPEEARAKLMNIKGKLEAVKEEMAAIPWR